MKNITGKTLIFYTFQGQKEPEHNVTTFKKSAPQQPKIRDILYELPLDYNKNSYHFRFKSEFRENDEKMYIMNNQRRIGWIDISNLLAKVPVINNSIFVKILTLPSDRDNKLFAKQKLRAIGLLDPNVPTANGNHKKNSQEQKPPKNVSEKSIPSKKNVGNLLSDENESDMKQKPVVKKSSQPESNKKVQSTEGKEIFEMDFGIKEEQTKTDKVVSQGKKVVPEQTPAMRLKGFQDQCKRVEDEQQNERIASKQYEQKLMEWGYSGHKTINNITTLLATLHSIWPEWPAVSLGDLLKPQDVNAMFKKAVIKVHPDKNRRKDFRTRYLSKRIFQLLNDAKKAQEK